MLILRKAVAEELFRQAKGTMWTGRVFSVDRNRECVPCLVEGNKFILEFNIPYFITQPGFFQDTLIPKTKGGVFVPKLEHRYLDILHVGDNGETQSLCKVEHNLRPRNPVDFARCMQAAVITFYRSSPQAGQFFFQTDASTRDLLLSVITSLPPELQSKYTFERYDELLEPFLGFSIVSNAL
jgi:hypothetical protein